MSATQRAADPRALQRAVRRIASADDPPWLHQEVARRMAARLEWIKLKPARVLEWWPEGSISAALLRQACPRAVLQGALAQVVPIRPRSPALNWWRPARWLGPATPDVVQADAVAPASVDLLWANMMLHLVGDPMLPIKAWHAALAVDGFLMFSTLGPGTLPELRRIYAEHGLGEPMAALVDMHDIGDMLVAAGFADPVMDQETITLTWASPAAALAELRTLGSNAHLMRHPGLRTPHWRARLLAALQETAGADGRIAWSFEVVYGHALRPLPRIKVDAESRVGLDDMRQMVRQRVRRD